MPPSLFSLQGPEHVNCKAKTVISDFTAKRFVKKDDYDTLPDPNNTADMPPLQALKLSQTKLCQAMRKLRMQPLLYPKWFAPAQVVCVCSVCKGKGHKKSNKKCPARMDTKLHLAQRDANFTQFVGFEEGDADDAVEF